MLPESADILQAEAFKEECLSALSVGEPIVIDASSVERLMTPIVQLILALASAAEEAGLAMSITGVGEKVKETFRILGLSDRLDSMKEA